MDNNFYKLMAVNLNNLPSIIEQLTIHNTTDIVSLMDDNINRFYKVYLRIHSKYYNQVKFNKKKLSLDIELANKTLISILRNYITLFNYIALSKTEITSALDKIIVEFRLDDSEYYNTGCDLLKLFRLSKFLSVREGYENGKEKMLMVPSIYSACCLMSDDTLINVKLFLLDLTHGLWVYKQKEDPKELMGILITLFGLYNLVHLEPNTIMDINDGN